MEQLERALIVHAAPTLAGLKTANLFWFTCEDLQEACQMVCRWNGMLLKKGIRLDIMKVNRNRILLYVYREKRLKKDLKQPDAENILKTCGYRTDNVREILARLREKLQNYQEFPHEIGLFLGYPTEDVRGFMENGGKNFCCSGCWKVYCNQCEKEKIFDRYKKCGAVYLRLFQNGRSVWQLTVAA